MSTKTTFKRVALVAVAALTLGSFSAVSASAAVVNTTLAVDALSVTTPTATGLVGTASTSTFSASFDAVGDTTVFGAVLVSLTKPTGSAVTLGDRNGDATANDPIATGTGASTAAGAVSNVTDAVAGDQVKIVPANGTTAASSNVAGTISITPDRPGTYVLTLTGTTLASPGVANSITATYTLTVRSLSYTTGDVAAATPFNTGSGVAGVANTVTLTAYSTQVASQKALVTVSGAGATIQSASAATVSADFLSAVVNASASSAVVVKTPTAGTVTVSLFNETAAGSGLYSTTAANTVTITVNAAAVNGAYVASTAYMNTSTTTPTPTSDATTAATAPTAAATASNTPVANILVSQVDGQATPANVATAATKAVVYEIAGAGALGTANNARLGSYIAVAAASANDNIVYIYPDGRSGLGTVTVKVNGVLVSTKTVKFYGAVASYTLTVKNKVLSVGSSADTQVLTVAALDANGYALPSATVNVSSSSTATATVDSATVTTGADGTAADIGVNGVKIGDAVITVGNAASSPTVSATATISVVKAGISSVALSFDKAEYNTGEKAVITVTAKNADGVLVGDEAYATLFTSAGITSSASLNGLTVEASVTTTNGVKTYTVYMPLAGGPVTISATLAGSVAAAIQDTVVTATTSVSNEALDAASEAIDAANAATDAANAAAEAADAATAAAQDAADAVAALSTSVSAMITALKKQITALTNLVIKIQKKVKA